MMRTFKHALALLQSQQKGQTLSQKINYLRENPEAVVFTPLFYKLPAKVHYLVIRWYEHDSRLDLQNISRYLPRRNKRLLSCLSTCAHNMKYAIYYRYVHIKHRHLRHMTFRGIQSFIEISGLTPAARDNFLIGWASRNGREKLVRYLLKHPQVDPCGGDNYAIKAACKHDFWGIVHLLLKDGRVDPAPWYESNEPPYQDRRGWTDLVHILLQDGHPKPAKCNFNNVLTDAIQMRDLEIVHLIVQDPRFSLLLSKHMVDILGQLGLIQCIRCIRFSQWGQWGLRETLDMLLILVGFAVFTVVWSSNNCI